MTTAHDILRSIVEEFRPDVEHYEALYRDFHQNPELGRQEKRTSEIITEHLQEAGYEVTIKIGGFGVVGVLRNGTGPTVLLRADMDALPIKEVTGLSYASTTVATDTDGERKPVMHACGHDTHIVSLMATSSLLANAKSEWSGTLISLFQPDEEHGAGAQAMLDDGLYDRIPKPDVVLGQHLLPAKAGVVLIRSGASMASADSLKIKIFGRGAHGSSPQDAIDPIVLAASIIVRLQTIVSREIAPQDIATVTCASIHGGTSHNIIPDEVELLLNIRAFDSDVRQKVITSIKRIINAECLASGVVKQPSIEQIAKFPLTVNEPEATSKIKDTFISYFGDSRVLEAPLWTASEDFSLLASSINVPSVFWNFGGVDHEIWENHQRQKGANPLPSPHQANYAPVIEPTLKTGIDAMTLAALTFLQTTEK
jgi:amidohydrolase